MRHDPNGGLRSLDDVLRGAELFDVVDGERVVLRYALRVDSHALGREGVIVAAAGGLRGFNLSDAFLPAIERQFAGARAVKVTTRRKGLAAKLIAKGYRIEGFILRKPLE